MLSNDRILAMATDFNYDLRHMTDRDSADAMRAVLIAAIRLAVAETAEACAKECDKRARLYRGNARDREAIVADVLAAAIREKAREGK